jgi:Gas vesicle synthesis protein GvpL/GvpF
MTKALAYCAFTSDATISLPEFGVNGEVIQQVRCENLSVLWSEVPWPFEQVSLQSYALDFHKVVSHVFAQSAIIPFRLLSVFDDVRSLTDFVTAHCSGFAADLERLRRVVQMECVLYFAPVSGAGTSGKDYLRRKAELLHQSGEFERSMQQALGPVSRGMRIRESKNGVRIFVLVGRGDEERFHSLVRALAVPQHLNRRTSGPWPPAEFLSDTVKMPEAAKKIHQESSEDGRSA